MPQIVQAGSINTAALVVPDLYVQLLPPAVQLLNGVPTNVVGLVGTANWGPVGVPVIVGSYADYVRAFGNLNARKYDMGTVLATAVLQGASNFRCVRVTDGTDVAASAVVQTNCITLTSKYTGTLGNSIVVSIGPGSAASSYKATVTLPGIGMAPEIFDNITGSANALWVAIAAAINNGQSGLRGPSQIITAAAGAGTTAPTTTTYTLASGTDGTATITALVLVGVDTVPRKGMYALRNSGASIGVLCDADDSTQWTTQVSFGLAEGIYFMLVTPAGDTVAAAATAKATAGIDTTTAKHCLGDWIYWSDPVNGTVRLVSPQGFFAGRLGNLSPHLSSLNQPVYGVVATQRSMSGAPYSNAELQAMAQAGMDVITNPIPGGSVFGVRMGRNSSSNPVTRGDNHTRMTNFIAATVNQGMGQWVGKLNSPDTRRGVKVTLDAFFGGLKQQGMIDDWQVRCDEPTAQGTNNPQNRIALGYLQADSKVRYLSVVDYLIANIEGGQSVQISRQPIATAA